TGALGRLADGDDLLIGEGGGLDDHLQHDGGLGHVPHRADLMLDGVVLAGAGQATLRTMSTSSAPLATDSRASNALTSAECWPEGNPHTVATFTVVSTGSIEGETQTENVPSSSASRSSAVTSAAVASGLSRVWSMRAAS